MPSHETLECPRCSAKFECKSGSITICHCSDIRLTEVQQAYIAANWQSCLCHQCLVEIKAAVIKKGEVDICRASVASPS